MRVEKILTTDRRSDDENTYGTYILFDPDVVPSQKTTVYRCPVEPTNRPQTQLMPLLDLNNGTAPKGVAIFRLQL